MAYNEFVTNLDLQEEKICEYDNIFMIGKIGVISTIKIRVIQEMIQMERPVHWSEEKIIKLANEIKCIEMFNATMINKLENTKNGT
jgi:hypothetical protein